MKLLVCGGAGFIGSNFVRQRLARSGDEVVVLDKLTYAGRRENLAGPRRPASCIGGDRGPEAGRATRSRAATRSSTSPPRRTSTARSPSPTRSSPRTRSAPTCCSRRRASAALRYVQVSTDEVYGSIEEGSFTEESPLQPSSPYSATKAGADLLVASYRHTFGLETLICRGSNNYGPYQYPEKLIPLMVLNALHGDKLPVYGDGMQVRNWIYVEDFARGIGTVLEHGVPGEVYNVGGPDEAPEPRGRPADHRVHGRRRVADRVRHRPPRPRPPLLARLREGRARSAGSRRSASPRARAHRRLVPRQRLVVGADPLRRLPRVLRAPVRPRARLAGRLALSDVARHAVLRPPEPHRLGRAVCCPDAPRPCAVRR